MWKESQTAPPVMWTMNQNNIWDQTRTYSSWTTPWIRWTQQSVLLIIIIFIITQRGAIPTSSTRWSESWMENSWGLNHCSVNLPRVSLLRRRPWSEDGTLWSVRCACTFVRLCVCVCVCVSVCKWVTAPLNFRVTLIRTRATRDYTRDQMFRRARASEKPAESTHFPLSLRCKHGHLVSTKQGWHTTGGFVCVCVSVCVCVCLCVCVRRIVGLNRFILTENEAEGGGCRQSQVEPNISVYKFKNNLWMR